jgi:anti-sigma factor RsiW
MTMACENILLVQAEFDGELDAVEAARAAQHRQSCAECRDAYAVMGGTRVMLQQEEATRERAPDRLRNAIQARLAAAAPVANSPIKPARRVWWRDGAGVALGAALAAGIALFVMAPAQQDMLDQIVAGHVRALQPGHLEDVISTDQHTVKPWFDGRIDFAPPVKDLASQQFPLLGGRLDYLDNRPVAALVYGHEKHIIDLYVWPGNGTAAPAKATQNGYNTVHWQADGMNFWAVSDIEASGLDDFVRDWRAAS